MRYRPEPMLERHATGLLSTARQSPPLRPVRAVLDERLAAYRHAHTHLLAAQARADGAALSGTARDLTARRCALQEQRAAETYRHAVAALRDACANVVGASSVIATADRPAPR